MRYTLKVILNGEIKRCGSDGKEYIQDEFNKLKNSSYKDIFEEYGQDAMTGVLRIEMYKKNRKSYNNTPKRDFSFFEYDLCKMIESGNISFTKTWVNPIRVNYVESEYAPKDFLTYIDPNTIIINPETYKKSKDKLPDIIDGYYKYRI